MIEPVPPIVPCKRTLNWFACVAFLVGVGTSHVAALLSADRLVSSHQTTIILGVVVDTVRLLFGDQVEEMEKLEVFSILAIASSRQVIWILGRKNVDL